MRVSPTIELEDYVYLFYNRVSNEITHRSIEETIESALFAYAGFVADEMQRMGVVEKRPPESVQTQE